MALSTKDKIQARKRRKRRVRKRVVGIPNKPRLCIYKSNRYIYAQLIDDMRGVTLTSVSSVKYNRGKGVKNRKSIDVAREVGEELGRVAMRKGIKMLVFDRSGYPYHGRIKALAEGIRAQGIKF